MSIRSSASRLRSVTLIAAGIAAVLNPVAFAAPASKIDLSQIVVVGDSLSAGFQNFSLFTVLPGQAYPNGGQTHGYASLIANQAHVPLTLPNISFPGIPPALVLNPDGSVSRFSPTPGGRINMGEQAYNLSVPGFTLADAIARPFPGSPKTNAIDAMSDSVLAYPGTKFGCGPLPNPLTGGYSVSQVSCAVALQPTTLLVDIGNNDALQALTFGAPPTDANTFQQQYHFLLTALSVTKAKIIVANIPDVTTIPFLMPVPVFEHICPPTTWLPGETAADFVVPDLNATSLGPCTGKALRSGALIAAAHNAVVAYNSIIASEAKAVGATVVDLNALMANVSTNHYVVKINGVPKTLTTLPLGGIFSLDLVHPTNTGYAIIANEFINVLNTNFRAGITPVSVDAVATADPLAQF